MTCYYAPVIILLLLPLFSRNISACNRNNDCNNGVDNDDATPVHPDYMMGNSTLCFVVHFCD